MTSRYTPEGARINRYWKRPKPRIYECNIRDAERFYKDSYSSYLQAKQLAPSYGTKGIEDEFATKWTMNRIGSDIDSSYRDPLRREASSALTSEYRSYEDPGQRPSHLSFSRHDSLIDHDREPRSSMRAKSMVQTRYDEESEEDLRDVEQRLERIKKLKEELGIKGDVPKDPYEGATSSKSILKKSSRLSPSDGGGSRSDYMQNSYSSLRAGSHSRGNDADNFDSKYNAKSERTTRFSSRYGAEENGEQNGRSYNRYNSDDGNSLSTTRSSRLTSKYGEDDSGYSAAGSSRKANKYIDESETSYSVGKSSRNANSYLDDDKGSYSTSRPTRKENKYSLDDDDSYSFSSTKKSSARQATASNGADKDDDEVVSNIRKNFPTSEEILERIKNMDADL